MSIFLSYRRDDTGGHAGRLYDGLVACFGDGVVFLDVEAIRAGDDFAADVQRGSATSDVVLVVIGRRWASICGMDGLRRIEHQDDVVRLEVCSALKGPARVIPVLVDRAMMPAPDELPIDLAPILRLNAVELSDRRWHDDLEQLITEIRGANRQPEIGEEVAGYQIDALIRHGQHGSVYRARAADTGDEVALRVFTGSMARSEALKMRLLGLEQSFAHVRHPALAKVLKTGIDGDRLFVVAEFVNGDTLRRIVARRGGLPAEEAARIVMEVADGLADAHACGIAHGNINPSNVVLSPSGKVQVIDFHVTVDGHQAGITEDVIATGNLLAHLIAGHEPARDELGEPWQSIALRASSRCFASERELATALQALLPHAPTAGARTPPSRRERFLRAMEYALSVHSGDVRKGTEIPYVAHLLAVCGMVLEDGGSEDEAIAALLHDTAEDHGGETRLADIQERFGAPVERIVRGCSDTLDSPKPQWKVRKLRHIQYLMTAPVDELRVALADKVHNARAIMSDLESVGSALWSRFNVSDAQEHLWYYRTLADLFAALHPGALARELDRTVKQIERLARSQ